MSLWNFAMIILTAFILNSTFYFIPYVMPRVNAMELLTYQAFTNGMILLLLILPKTMWTADKSGGGLGAHTGSVGSTGGEINTAGIVKKA